MDAWEGEKLNTTNGRSKERLSGAGGGVIKRGGGRKRSPPALKKLNGIEPELDGEVTDPEEEDPGARAADDRDSSSDSSESSNSSSSSSSSASSRSSGGSGSHHHHHHHHAVRGPKGSLPGGMAANFANMWEQDEHGEFIVITCAENEAKLYKERFGRGSIGRSVLFRSRWLTPNEFQAVSGRQSSKDWKRSIRLRGRCLKEYINDGLFKEHEKSCTCKVCLRGDMELLRQEGVTALAAKRRRLSQADGGTGSGSVLSQAPLQAACANTSTGGNNGSIAAVASELAPPTVGINVATPTTAVASMASTEERKLPGSTGLGAKRKSGSRGNKKSQRVWSPSGELAQEMEQQDGDGGSSNEEENDLKQTGPENSTPSKSSVIDASDFLPRRSKRSAHRKHTGHRTELGTYTRKPSEWDAEEVAEFLRLQGFTDYAHSFQEYEINGQSMFLLKEHHLLEKFSMKLGPALRLLDTISRLRHPPA